MIHIPAKGIAAALALAACAVFGVARAADPLPAQAALVTASGAATPSQITFTISTASAPEDLTITLTDAQAPAALTSAGIVVTQNGAIAASALLAAPATTATASLPAATGTYTMSVFGVPGSGFSVGTFRACVAPTSNPSNCIQDASLAGSISTNSTAKDPAVSTLYATLTVATADTYTFTYADAQFPILLATAPTLALFQGSTQIALGITSGSTLSLSPGTYQLLGIAQADPTVKGGLYGVSVVGSLGATLYNAMVPVGQLAAPTAYVNQNSQSVTLAVTDYGFPGTLASASGLLTLGGTVVGQASSAGGAASFTAPAGTLELWSYGSAAATAGTFSVDLSAASSDLLTVAQGVGPVGAAYAYAYVTPALAAGAYTAAAADLKFPSILGGLSFAVAQAGLILQQAATAQTVNFTASAGPVVLLVGAQVTTNGGTNGTGLFDVNLQSTGAAAQLAFDHTQTVNGASSAVTLAPLVITANGGLNVTLDDLKFPAAFDSLALVISRGSEVLGEVYGGGVAPFAGTPGTYQLTLVATPSATQNYGVYSVSVVNAPAPTVTLTSNVATAVTGASVQLSWTSTNTTACTASGGAFTGTQAINSTTPVSVVLSATTTFTLTCTGAGGSASSSVTVTATAAPSSSHGGGGAIDPIWLMGAVGLLGMRGWRALRRGFGLLEPPPTLAAASR